MPALKSDFDGRNHFSKDTSNRSVRVACTSQNTEASMPIWSIWPEPNRARTFHEHPSCRFDLRLDSRPVGHGPRHGGTLQRARAGHPRPAGRQSNGDGSPGRAIADDGEPRPAVQQGQRPRRRARELRSPRAEPPGLRPVAQSRFQRFRPDRRLLIEVSRARRGRPASRNLSYPPFAEGGARQGERERDRQAESWRTAKPVASPVGYLSPAVRTPAHPTCGTAVPGVGSAPDRRLRRLSWPQKRRLSRPRSPLGRNAEGPGLGRVLN